MSRVKGASIDKLLFCADTHFGHGRIIAYCNRPFTTADEMNEQLIVNWNSIVDPADSIWHLGDFCFGPLEQVKSVFNRLNGQKHLILGNHDRLPARAYAEDIGFVTVHQSWRMKIGRHNVLLRHRPPLQSEPWPKGIHIQLCGHIHDKPGWWENKVPRPRIYNISVEKTNYRPVSLEEIVALNSVPAAEKPVRKILPRLL